MDSSGALFPGKGFPFLSGVPLPGGKSHEHADGTVSEATTTPFIFSPPHQLWDDPTSLDQPAVVTLDATEMDAAAGLTQAVAALRRDGAIVIRSAVPR